MATKVYKADQVELFSGKKVPVRPLKISLLREFMKEFENLESAMMDNVKSLDVIMNCVAVAMRQFDSEIADDREKLEDEIDLPTAYKIIEVAAGIKLGDDDPNPQAADSDGTN